MDIGKILIYIVGALLLGIIAGFVTHSIFVGIALPILLVVAAGLSKVVKDMAEVEEAEKEKDN